MTRSIRWDGRRRARGQAGGRQRILSSIHSSGDPYWVGSVRAISLREHPGLLRWLFEFTKAMWRYDHFILRGTSGFSEGYRDFIAATMVRMLRPGCTVIMSDATIAPGSRALHARLPRSLHAFLTALSLVALRAADSPAVRWCVLSTAELGSFPDRWRVDPARVLFTPFCYTIEHQPPRLPDQERGYVFAGGNSLRDWRTLIKALDGSPVRVRVATNATGPQGSSNMEFGPVPPERFNQLLASAELVVVPLESSTRSAGQQTYLNAQRLGVPVVVTEAAGVHDYIENGVTGVIVPPEPQALRDAVLALLDEQSKGARTAMIDAAREVALKEFSPDVYRRRLVTLALGGAEAT